MVHTCVVVLAVALVDSRPWLHPQERAQFGLVVINPCPLVPGQHHAELLVHAT